MIFNKKFRSRGVRFLLNDIHSPTMKIYYDSDTIKISIDEIKYLLSENIILPFEESYLLNGTLESINFHNSFQNGYSDYIYAHIDSSQRDILENIPLVLDDKFMLYTIGYKIYNNSVCGYTFYFYPVIRKDDRMGICGVTDSEIISNYANSLANWLIVGNTNISEVVHDFINNAYKFKGISVSFNGNNTPEFKIYIKINYEILIEFFKKYKLDINVDKYISLYGDVVLIAQRLYQNLLMGYNLYFLH